MNLCPCAHLGDVQKACGCTPAVVTKYQKRSFGPILDRIDINVEAPRVDDEKSSDDRLRETSEAIRARVQTARKYKPTGFLATVQKLFAMPTCEWGKFVSSANRRKKGQSLIRAAMTQLGLSARELEGLLCFYDE